MNADRTFFTPDVASTWLRRGVWLVFAAALGVRLGYWFVVREFPGAQHTNFYLVQGSPFGDAMAWHNLARSFAEGSELYFWQGRRLAYPLFLSLVYAWTGPSTPAAVVLNLVASAATAALVVAIFSRIYHRAVGLAVAFWFALDSVAATCACVQLSETMGTFLLVWHFWLLLRGLDAARPARPLFASGVLFGLSNVTRTMTLAALPLMVIGIVFCNRRQGRVWFAGFADAAVWTAGVTLVVLPLMLSNYQRQGIFSISDNTTVNLFAGTSPEFLEWSPEVEYVADRAGVFDVAQRYRFYGEKFRENVRLHRRWIAEQLVRRTDRIFWVLSDIPLPTVWAWSAAWLLTGRSLGRRRWVVALVVPAIWWMYAPGLAYLAIGAGMLRSLWLRPFERSAFLTALLWGTIVPLAIFGLGNNDQDRLYLLFRWAGVGLALGSVDALARRLLRGAPTAVPTPGDFSGPALCALGPRWRRALVGAGGAWLLLTLCVLGWRNYVRPLKFAYLPIAPTAVDSLLRHVHQKHPEVFTEREQRWFSPGNLLTVPVTHWEYQKPNGRLILWQGELLPEMYYLPKGAQTDTIWRSFYDREYERTVAMLRTLPAFNWPVPFTLAGIVFPGDLRSLGGENVLLLARINDDPARPIQGAIEGIALVPYDAATGKLDLSRFHDATQTPEHLRVLVELRGLKPMHANP